jgi:hypothetical protein
MLVDPPICRSCSNRTPYRFRYATDGLLRLGWRCSKGITTRNVRADCSSYSRGVAPPSILPGGNLEWRQPALDQRERMLVGVFLRRYVAWCVRSRRHERIPGSLELVSSLST